MSTISSSARRFASRRKAPTARRSVFRFATKLPNAGNESGLGLDTTDFLASVLIGKTTQSVRVVVNVGLAILGDPTVGDRQNDELAYGVSFARALTNAAEVVGEVNGRINSRNGQPPPGTEVARDVSLRRQVHRGRLARGRRGAGGHDQHRPGVGVAAGFTYVFHAFRVPDGGAARQQGSRVRQRFPVRRRERGARASRPRSRAGCAIAIAAWAATA